MKIKDLFIFEKHKPVHANKVEIYDNIKDGIRYITRTVQNNGIKGYIKMQKHNTCPANTISIPMNGEGLLTACVQTKEYYVANLVGCLVPIKKMSIDELTWYATEIRKNRFRFSSHGREVNEERLMGLEICPIDSNVVSFVEKRMKNFNTKMPENYIEIFESALKDSKMISLKDMFVKVGNGKTKINKYMKGNTPVISSTEKYGGVTNWLEIEPDFEGRSFTLSNNGSICYFNFINKEFCATPDITIFRLKKNMKINELLIIWLKVNIEKNRFKYNYGRKLKTRMDEITFPFPHDKEGNINWSFFEIKRP